MWPSFLGNLEPELMTLVCTEQLYYYTLQAQLFSWEEKLLTLRSL
jgi:hypothetical protein